MDQCQKFTIFFEISRKLTENKLANFQEMQFYYNFPSNSPKKLFFQTIVFCPIVQQKYTVFWKLRDSRNHPCCLFDKFFFIFYKDKKKVWKVTSPKWITSLFQLEPVKETIFRFSHWPVGRAGMLNRLPHHTHVSVVRFAHRGPTP